jgi:hypothetical protein
MPNGEQFEVTVTIIGWAVAVISSIVIVGNVIVNFWRV